MSPYLIRCQRGYIYEGVMKDRKAIVDISNPPSHTPPCKYPVRHLSYTQERQRHASFRSLLVFLAHTFQQCHVESTNGHTAAFIIVGRGGAAYDVDACYINPFG